MEQSLDAIAAFSAEGLDVSGVEFAGLDDQPVNDPLARAKELRQFAQRRGLQIIGYCVAAELLRPRAAQRVEIEKLKRQIDVADALGAPNFRHDVTRGFGDNATGIPGRPSFANALKIVAPAIREIAEYAKSKAIKSSLENHGFYMQSPSRVEKLIQTVAHRNFGLTMDMGNFLCVNANPVAAVKRLTRYAGMVHVKDFHVRRKIDLPLPGWFGTPTRIALRGAIVGHGVIDIARQIQILKKARYRGWLSLEFEGIEEPLAAIRMGLEYLRKLIA